MKIIKSYLWHVMPLHWIGAAIGAAASLIGSAKAGSQSEGLSKYQMDYQRDMANSAHQRQVKDLRNAGLNPILSAKLGGAGNVSAPGAQIPDYGQAVSRGMDVAKTGSAVKLQKAQGKQAEESAKLMNEQHWTEQVKRNQLGQQAARDNAQASKAQQEYYTERVRTESETLRLEERRAEAMYWRAMQGYGKALQSAKGWSEIPRALNQFPGFGKGKTLPSKPQIFKPGGK